MSRYVVVRDYPYPIDEVWDVMTSPELVAQWTTTGRGGRPEGFLPEPGTDFRLIGKPTIGWAGVVYCTVVAAEPPRLLHYTWKGDQASDDVTDVVYRLESTPTGTRFTWEHTGFTGIGGFAMSRLLGRVRRTMMDDGVPVVLAAHHAGEGRGGRPA
ncbi:MAG: SRPBCC domain-containing protein [Microbacterium sp.]|uniref:SRPBCC family protein n=1 Tax=Microbacterium sp. TaxID=51671 RepID=UPI001AC2FEDF|nr:SRPBCC domain-containing protein [Microbacterium sp.]MBN9152415.1 SRPBCC domain-containing protein [Microbacterium sp.]